MKNLLISSSRHSVINKYYIYVYMYVYIVYIYNTLMLIFYLISVYSIYSIYYIYIKDCPHKCFTGKYE